MASNTYSFLDIACAISGPGGNFNLSTGSGVEKGGLTITYVEDKATMVIGADGSGMHSLHAGTAATATIRLLKTAVANKQLNDMYRFQTTSSAYYGQNTITIRDPVRGDATVAQGAGFRKHPDIQYAEEGDTMVWSFNCIAVDPILGDGSPISTINQGAT